MTRVERAVQGEPEVNLREKAYRAFTSQLLNEGLKAGQFISQRELVDLTGFPLGAVRELIPRLEAEGLIRTIPQRGMQIAQVDLSLIHEAFQFRLFIERQAIALFIGSASDATLAHIRQGHEAILARARHVGSPASMQVLIDDAQRTDWTFHDQMVDSLNNGIISNNYRVNSIKIRLIRQTLSRIEADIIVPVMDDHMKVLTALERRDTEQAVTALSEHIEHARLRALGF